MGPRLSVVMAVYERDRADFLATALASIAAQTQPPEEVVVVVDGPLPDTLDAAIDDFEAGIHGIAVVVVRLAANGGLAAALNAGIKAASGDWILRMDADDVMRERRVERQLEYIAAHPEVDIFGGYAFDIDSAGESLGERRVPTGHDVIARAIWACPFIHPTVAFRRDRVVDIGMYSTRTHRAEDMDLWFRCHRAGFRFANIPESLLYYRVHGDYHARNDWRVAVSRAQVGLRGAWDNGLSLRAYLGVLWPVARAAMPAPVRRRVQAVVGRMDPRR